MKIGIDARFYGTSHTGIGRYVENLVQNLGKVDKLNTYIIFGPPEIKSAISSFPNFHHVLLTTKPYTFAEQLVNPIIFYTAKLDLLHLPHFNAPILYLKPYILTIHDLIKHLSTGKDTTTLTAFSYYLKHAIYKLLVLYHLKKAKHLITPSEYWKAELIKKYFLPPTKISVTYEAVSASFKKINKTSPEKLLAKFDLRKPFLVYTGNLYPHKNLPFAVTAINEFNALHEHDLQLAIVCGRHAFLGNIPSDPLVRFAGSLTDAEIVTLYSQAVAFIQPSLIEGFGLVGLEAMSVGLPVLSSTATCLPEFYANAALYFNPHDKADLIQKINYLISNPDVRKDLIDKGTLQVKKFSWSKMARLTKAIYLSCASL